MGIYIFKKPCNVFSIEKNVLATIELLKSSLLVSLSCATRVYLSAILIGIVPDISICVAAFLVMYSVYLLDRTLDSEEDAINKTELIGSSKKIGYLFTALSFMSGAYILANMGMLWLAFFPFITGYLYSKGIKIGKFSLRLKGGLGIKNIVVGITWCVLIAGLVCGYGVQWWMIFVFYGVKVFINSAIDDFKDIEGDSLAGIKTLPVILGKQKTHALLFTTHLLIHVVLLIALFRGVLAFEPLIILYSFVCGAICILFYSNDGSKKHELVFFKDLESTMTIILLIFVNIVYGL